MNILLLSSDISVSIFLNLLNGTSNYIHFCAFSAAIFLHFYPQMLLIRSIFLYLDRTYAFQPTTTVLSLWDMGLLLLRQHLKKCPEVEERTVQGLLRLVEQERCVVVP